jgi:hypothetical protein
MTGTGNALSFTPKCCPSHRPRWGNQCRQNGDHHQPPRAAVLISSIIISGTNAGEFGQTNICGNSIAGLSTCTITVTFTPAATGTRTGILTITDPTSPQKVTLTGTGS